MELIVLGAILIASAAIRLFRLGDFPDTIVGDEADTVQNAARILFTRAPLSQIFGLDWSQNPAFSVYKQAAFLALFGFTSAAMRLPSALASTLALVPFYFLLRRQVTPLAASLATILLSTELWYLNFSRSGWILIDIALYMLMSMLALLVAIDRTTAPQSTRRSNLVLFGIAGLFCCLGLYGYTAGRTITLGVLAFAPFALAFHRRFARSLLLGFVTLFAVEVALFAPQAATALRDWQHFNQRTGVVFIGNSPAFKTDPVGTMLHQLGRNLRGPWDGGVNNTPQYTPVAEPQLSSLTGLLVLSGMLLSLASPALRKQPETWLWWLMLLAGWAFTQLLTVNTPNGARGIGYMPTLVYFAGLGLAGIEGAVRQVSRTWEPRSFGAWFPSIFLTAIVVASAILSVSHYVAWQRQPETRVARYPYLTAREFPSWAADIERRAATGQGVTNVHVWRSEHPIADIADPYGEVP